MKNQNKDLSNYEFIKPLVERPDLDPDMAFVNNLRKEITQTNMDSHSISLPKRLNILGVGLLAISTIFILIFSIEHKNPSMGTQKVEEAQITPIDQYDIDELLSNHPNYNEMYQLVLTEAESTKAAEMFVLYLETLKQGDMNEFKKYSSENLDFKIKPLINDYKQIDFETLAIEDIIWSQSEPSIEVQISYQRKKKAKAKELRSLHVHINDGINVSVYENFKWDEWNK